VLNGDLDNLDVLIVAERGSLSRGSTGYEPIDALFDLKVHVVSQGPGIDLAAGKRCD
jgi:hypothetical protein